MLSYIIYYMKDLKVEDIVREDGELKDAIVLVFQSSLISPSTITGDTSTDSGTGSQELTAVIPNPLAVSPQG